MFRTFNAIGQRVKQFTSTMSPLQQIPFNTVSTKNKVHPFMAFFKNVLYARTGRSWSVQELRIKSPEDLEKLWFVLLKERNALSTYQHYCAQNKSSMKGFDRIAKCKASMKAILQVVGERRHACKEVTNDREFLKQRSLARKTRSLEAFEARVEKSRNKTTPIQHNHVNIQDKVWRRKTMGQNLKLKPALQQQQVV